MGNVLQFIGTFASIFSVPLAIILYFKTSDTRQNKIRLEIIRSLSYRIGEGKSLDKMEVSAVFNSKVREHNIKKPFFTEETILEDIIADAVSNPFLTSEQKTAIIKNVGEVLETYGVVERIKQKGTTELTIEYAKYGSTVSDVKRKRNAITSAFAAIATILSVAISIATFILGENFVERFSDFQFPIEVLISIGVTLFASVLTFAIEKVLKKMRKE